MFWEGRFTFPPGPAFDILCQIETQQLHGRRSSAASGELSLTMYIARGFPAFDNKRRLGKAFASESRSTVRVYK